MSQPPTYPACQVLMLCPGTHKTQVLSAAQFPFVNPNDRKVKNQARGKNKSINPKLVVAGNLSGRPERSTGKASQAQRQTDDIRKGQFGGFPADHREHVGK